MVTTDSINIIIAATIIIKLILIISNF